MPGFSLLLADVVLNTGSVYEGQLIQQNISFDITLTIESQDVLSIKMEIENKYRHDIPEIPIQYLKYRIEGNYLIDDDGGKNEIYDNGEKIKLISDDNNTSIVLSLKHSLSADLSSPIGLTYNFTQENPGKILDHIKITDIENIDSLTIIGLLDERDFKIINKMKNLKYLDLTNTYITYEPERRKKIQDDREAKAAIAKFLNNGIEEKRKNGEIDDLSYVYNKSLTELMVKSSEINFEKDYCIMPELTDMPVLITVKMPLRATIISNNAFNNCPSLSNISWPIALKKIEGGCFVNTAIKEFVFPGTLSNINFKDQPGPSQRDSYTRARTFEQSHYARIIDFSKCTDLQKFDIYNYLINDEFFGNLTEIKLPHNWKDYNIYGTKQGTTYYINTQLDDIGIIISKYSPNIKVYFETPNAPKKAWVDNETEIKIKIYIPKGSLNEYYMAFDGNDKVEFIEF